MLTVNLANAPHKEAPLVVAAQNPGMTKRKPVSKRLRFEIFKRDGFRCIHCGATPQTVALLVVDHVNPVKLGGETEAHNLVTACVPCNSGKGAVPLGERKFKVELDEATRDHTEQLREFLAIQREIADTNEEHLEGLEADWDRLTRLRRPHNLRGHLRGLAKTYSLDQLRSGMERLGGARTLNGPVLPYFRGILKNLDKPYVPPPAPAPVAPPSSPLANAARALVGAVIREMNETKEPKSFEDRCARARAACAYAAGGTEEEVSYYADPEWQHFNEDEELNALAFCVDAWEDNSFDVRIWDRANYDAHGEALKELSDEIFNTLGYLFHCHDKSEDPEEKRDFLGRWLEREARSVSKKEREIRARIDLLRAFGIVPAKRGDG